MRTSVISINGAEYPLCFSTRVLIALEERGRKEGMAADAYLGSILNDGSISEAFWLLHILMDAGARNAKLSGGESPEVPSFDNLIDTVEVHDYSTIFSRLGEAISAGQHQNVEAVPPKNSKNVENTPGA